jgi:hypothetical protein
VPTYLRRGKPVSKNHNPLSDRVSRAKLLSVLYEWRRIVSPSGAAAMHINTNHTDQVTLACDFEGKKAIAPSGSDSPPKGVSLMPFIHVGTFLVAAYLRTTQPVKAPR